MKVINIRKDKQIPVGVDNFEELVNKVRNYGFVDKTLLIKEIVDEYSKVLLITRPRRWGKSLNMSMLEHFFSEKVLGESTAHLFDDLAVAQVDNGAYMAHQGKHPVISLSFKDAKRSNFSGAVEAISEIIEELYYRHEYLLESNRLSENIKKKFQFYLDGDISRKKIETSLLFLSQCLSKHYEKSIYILIDEYDTPLNYAYHHDYVEEMAEFMKNLLSSSLKGNPHLEKGVMTGILRVSKDSMLSGLNNVKVFSLLHEKYAEYFGFSEAEVRQLFSVFGMDYKMEAIRRYYNGYHIGNLMLYNPWSITQCLAEGVKLQPYWVDTSDDRLLEKIFFSVSSLIKEQLQKLIADESHSIRVILSETVRFEGIDRNPEAFWSLLFSSGYLTLSSQERVDSGYKCDLSIPNREVASVYLKIFSSWLRRQLDESRYDLFLNYLVSGQIKELIDEILSDRRAKQTDFNNG